MLYLRRLWVTISDHGSRVVRIGAMADAVWGRGNSEGDRQSSQAHAFRQQTEPTFVRPGLRPQAGSRTCVLRPRKAVYSSSFKSLRSGPMKSILNDIVDELERLAVSLDALELALISKGPLRNGDIVANSAIPESIVRQRLSDLRMAIDSLPTEGAAEPGTTSSS